MAKAFFRPTIRSVDLCLVQTDTDRNRLVALGAVPEHVHVVGSAKYDVPPSDPAGEAAVADVLRAAGISPEDKVILGGSTWPGEETALIELYRRLRDSIPSLKLILTPRHAERGNEVVSDLERSALRYARRSRLAGEGGNSDSTGPVDVLLVDTTGELRHFYAHATVIFVGKSLMNHGGQNIIEPALCGKAIVVGPYMENFPVILSEFLAARALIQVRNADELGRTIESLLTDDALREGHGERARQLVLAKRGVVERSVGLMGNRLQW
jgi:3-deoxy-D-manno-octulosonic-acid transferase